MEEIRALDGRVLAVSVDAVEDNARLAQRKGLELLLLSDPTLQVIDAYGLRHPDGGIKGDVARPATFIIDRQGRIVWRDLTDNWRVRVRPEAVLKQMKSFR